MVIFAMPSSASRSYRMSVYVVMGIHSAVIHSPQVSCSIARRNLHARRVGPYRDVAAQEFRPGAEHRSGALEMNGVARIGNDRDTGVWNGMSELPRNPDILRVQ